MITAGIGEFGKGKLLVRVKGGRLKALFLLQCGSRKNKADDHMR